jgi:hypothetical protein
MRPIGTERRITGGIRGGIRLAAAIAASAAALASAIIGPAVAQSPPVERDAKAIAAVTSMGKYLRTLKTFVVSADTTIDEVLENGQKVQFGGTVRYQVQAPNRLRADVRGERRHRQFYFDGKTVTQYAPRVKYYASVPAPGTIAQALEAADKKYDIDVPLADLFLWGTDKSGVDDIREAMVLGVDRIGAVDCDHYAFRQEGVDWQVWIERGKRPLPCKLVITTTDEPAQPQYSAVFKWDLAPKIDPAAFTFVPPKDAKKIQVAPVAGKS